MFSQAFAQEAQKGTVAVGGYVTAAVTDSPWIAIVTVLYVVIQALYLLRKWWREEKDWRAQRKQQGLDSDAAPLGPE